MSDNKSIYQQHRPGGSDDLFLRLKDGDAVKMRIYSKPAIVLYKEGQRSRYAWIVINHNNKKAQVFGSGVSIYSQIADLEEDWGEPTEFDITVRRKGSGQFDTEYSVTPVKNSTAPTKEQEAEADKIDLLNATKGKWLEDYMKDGELPAPVLEGKEEESPPKEPDPELTPEEEALLDSDEPIDLKDVPF
jgi:hypothetical protein